MLVKLWCQGRAEREFLTSPNSPFNLLSRCYLISTKSSFEKQVMQTLHDFITFTCPLPSLLILKTWLKCFSWRSPMILHTPQLFLIPESIDSILLDTLFSQELDHTGWSWLSSLINVCFSRTLLPHSLQAILRTSSLYTISLAIIFMPSSHT